MAHLAWSGYSLSPTAMYGAARVLQGEDFRYALIGRRLEQYMSREGPTV